MQRYQVMLNLCVNARDAMPDGGILTLSVAKRLVERSQAQKHREAQAGHSVVITVADTGVGMTPRVVDPIFEPCFTTKTPGKGTGLGLATVSRIVNHHGGLIKLTTEPNAGTQFQVSLPALASDEQSDSVN
jgi:signal transduction histidine kinase